MPLPGLLGRLLERARAVPVFEIVLGGLGSILLLAGVLALAAVVVVRWPADHFVAGREFLPGRSKALQITLRVGLNVLGVLVIVVGLVLSIPGVPGPGLAVAFIGLTLVDFPGRQRVVRAVLVRPSVRRAIDRLRARFGRAPLVLDASPASPDQRRGKRP